VGAQVGGVGAQVVIYIGDDLGDLPAFEVVEALRGEGMLGLTVASVDPHDADVPAQVAQRADMVLDGPTAVVAWLAGLAAMLT
jgi:trehalose 6-phosphate phosphatase